MGSFLHRHRPPRPAHCEQQRDDRDEERHHADIHRRDPVLEVVDVAAQCELHVAQLGADGQQLGAEPVDPLDLLRREPVDRAFRRARKLGELLLGVLELLGELLLLGAEPLVGLRLHSLDHLERPPRDSAAPPAICSTALMTKSPLLAKAWAICWPSSDCCWIQLRSISMSASPTRMTLTGLVERLSVPPLGATSAGFSFSG